MFKSHDESYKDSVKHAAASLDMDVSGLIDYGLSLAVAKHKLPSLPPRLQGRYSQ